MSRGADILTLVQGKIDAGDLEGARRLAEDHTRTSPQDHIGFNILGALALKQGDLDAAIPALEQAANLAQERPGYWSNLGVAYARAGRLSEAQSALSHANRLAPDQFQLLSNLGLIERDLGDYDAALEHIRAALSLDPIQVGLKANYANLLADVGEFAEAERLLNEVLAVQPGNLDAQVNMATLLFRQGRFAEGFVHHLKWNRANIKGPDKEGGRPVWDGTPTELHVRLWLAEGIGDQVLYASILLDALARQPDLTVSCNERLIRLFRRSFPGVRFIPTSTDEPHDLQLPFYDLIGLFRQSTKDFPAPRAYLFADRAHCRAIRARYELLAQGRRIIGIAWASKNVRFGHHKSSGLAPWTELLRRPDLFFVSVQYGDVAAEVAAAKAATGTEIHVDPDIDQMNDLDPFAAQIVAMDAVVAVSNTAVHLAGALGVLTFVMLPPARGRFWYWCVPGDAPPWYPSVTLSRRHYREGWEVQIADACRFLDRHFEGKS